MKNIVLILALMTSISGFAQTPLHRRAEKSFGRFEFATAATLYEKILKRSPADQTAKQRLTQCHRFLKTRSDWRSQPANKQNYSGANVPVK